MKYFDLQHLHVYLFEEFLHEPQAFMSKICLDLSADLTFHFDLDKAPNETRILDEGILNSVPQFVGLSHPAKDLLPIQRPLSKTFRR